MYDAFTRVHGRWYQGMERKAERASSWLGTGRRSRRDKGWTVCSLALLLPYLGCRLGICLGEEGKVLLPISAAPVGPVTQQGNSPFIQQQKQSALHLLMRHQKGSQKPAKTR